MRIINFTFFVLLFLVTSAKASELQIKWRTNLLVPRPDIASSGSHVCFDEQGTQITKLGAREPSDVAFSNDGLTYVIGNILNDGIGNRIIAYKLTTPFDLDTVKNDCSQFRFNPWKDMTTETNERVESIRFSRDGSKFFIVNENGEIFSYDLSTPFDLSTRSYITELDLTGSRISIEFSADGMQLFKLDGKDKDPTIEVYDLPGPYDTSSATLNYTLDLNDTEIETLQSPAHMQALDFEFNDTGSAIYILAQTTSPGNDTGFSKSAIFQYNTAANYDISSVQFKGRWNVVFDPDDDHAGIGIPYGFAFGAAGMKLFVTNHRDGDNQHDKTNEYNLECPYGIYECTSDARSNLGSQVELAKQNISLNTSTIFKRFEWIKRNRNKENLNNFSINIDTDNRLLVSLKDSLQVSLNNKKPQNDKKNKKSDWSFWNHADISIGSFDATSFEKPKQIRTRGLTFGADKKYGENKYFGTAIRYGNSDSDIKFSAQGINLKSLTLNMYGTVPIDQYRYTNAILGLSILRFDQRFLGKITGERNGKQAFTALNFRTKKTYGSFNFTPSARFNYGITNLSNFTDFISKAKPGTDIIYQEETFENGEIAAGFLFDIDEIKVTNGISRPNGGFEMILDISPDISFNHSNAGGTKTNTATIKKYSHKKLKGNIGIETVYDNGITFSINYEKIMHKDKERSYSHQDIFLIKFGRINNNDSEFAMNFNPNQNNKTELSYTKKFNNFNVKIDSNYNLFSKIPDYGASIKLSGTF